MRKINFTVIVIILLVNVNFGQKIKPKITATEKRQAKQIAARFYNRFAETQDITPLIDEFFVSDFIPRLKQTLIKDDEISQIKEISEKDISQFYKAFINYFFIYLNLYEVLSHNSKADNHEEIDKLINAELKLLLNDTPQILMYQSFNIWELPSLSETENVDEYKQEIVNLAEFNNALRKINTAFHKNTVKRNYYSYTANDFGVIVTNTNEGWIDYPNGTKFLRVTFKKEFPITMLLIQQETSLKIATVFPDLNL